MKRGGGRRYYRPSDIDLLRGIRHLLYGQGYTIRGVQRLLREQGLKFIQSAWQGGVSPPPHGAVESNSMAESPSGTEATAIELNRDRDSHELQGSFDGRREPQFNKAIPSQIRVASSDRTLASDDLHKLKGALKELVECRNLIAAAVITKS